MDVQRLFEEKPPREPLFTLPAIIRDWKWRFGQGGYKEHMRDEVVEFTRSAPNFRTAADRACRSRRPDGKMHNHQSRVPLLILLAFRDRIIHHRANIENGVGDRSRHNALDNNFDWMHDYLKHHLAPPGIGPVTNYDVAVRLGAYLKAEPVNLYLHAGVREGWFALCQAIQWETPKDAGRITRINWPRSLRSMPADEVEDFLCTYRDIFPNLSRRSYEEI